MFSRTCTARWPPMPVNALSTPVVTLDRPPDCHRTIGENCHSLRIQRAVALENARNAQETRRQLRDAQILHRAGDVLNRTLSFQETLERLADVEAEKARLKKELAKIEAEIEKAKLKLNNPDFVQKVPPNVLEEHKKRLAEWQAKQQQVKSALDLLQG